MCVHLHLEKSKVKDGFDDVSDLSKSYKLRKLKPYHYNCKRHSVQMTKKKSKQSVGLFWLNLRSCKVFTSIDLKWGWCLVFSRSSSDARLWFLY